MGWERWRNQASMGSSWALVWSYREFWRGRHSLFLGTPSEAGVQAGASRSCVCPRSSWCSSEGGNMSFPGEKGRKRRNRDGAGRKTPPGTASKPHNQLLLPRPQPSCSPAADLRGWPEDKSSQQEVLFSVILEVRELLLWGYHLASKTSVSSSVELSQVSFCGWPWK